jgi:hypothetical protein
MPCRMHLKFIVACHRAQTYSTYPLMTFLTADLPNRLPNPMFADDTNLSCKSTNETAHK